MQLKQKLGEALRKFVTENQRIEAIPIIKRDSYPQWLIVEKNKMLAKNCVNINNGMMRLY